MNYTTSIRTASKLMEDDRFKMGGSMYRIADTSLNLYNEQIIWFYPVDDDVPTTMQMVVPQDLKFKIYNQKTKK